VSDVTERSHVKTGTARDMSAMLVAERIITGGGETVGIVWSLAAIVSTNVVVTSILGSLVLPGQVDENVCDFGIAYPKWRNCTNSEIF
jgi:hypothetical protein